MNALPALITARLHLVILLFLAALLPGCAAPGTTPPAAETDDYALELDIFSGRPNPRQALDPAAAESILERIADLPAVAPVPTPGDLGYRGMLIFQGETAVIRVYDGTVYLSGDGTLTYAGDADRALEKELLAQLRPAIDAGLYDEIAADLSRP